MTGIYKQDFIDLLRDNLKHIKISNKNIVVPCPWCEEHKVKKDHYHLYISLHLPIFRCFKARCPKFSGTIKQLIKKITLNDDEDLYINKEELNKYKLDLEQPKKIKYKNYIFPKINEDENILKTLYLKKRFGFNNISISDMKGLIFNIQEFLRINNIKLNEEQENLIPYLRDNFIGFMTDKQSVITMRNINNNSSFKFYKLQLYETELLDYFSLFGYKNSNKIILSEGIFDIYSEYIFDTLKLRNEVFLYAAGLSFSFKSLLKSVIFDHQIFQPDVIILSDRDVNLKKYNFFKKECGYLLNSLTIMYNKAGKDFNTFPIIPEKFII